MPDNAKNLADVILAGLQLLALIAGGLWAVWRLRRERLHVPRVSFDLACNFFGPQRDVFIAEFVTTMSNEGSVKHVVSDVLLRVRGISTSDVPKQWDGHGERLWFPLMLLDDNIIYKRKYASVFVEPGVSQPLTYVTQIATSVAFVLARVEFRYDEKRTHSAERVFAVPRASTQGSGVKDGDRAGSGLRQVGSGLCLSAQPR